MEEASPLARIVASPLFMAGVLVAIVILGLILRLVFHVPNSEYKHKGD
jgi:hypothetical protein